MARSLFPIAILDLDQQAATLAIGIQRFLQAHDAFRLGTHRIMRGKIRCLQLFRRHLVGAAVGEDQCSRHVSRIALGENRMHWNMDYLGFHP